mmetsp:Transcript_435/g.708  ORF Transcript_435/g.708 Transcript_435/m.708 type:complete len:214 (-) Transcript_435:639-1280(-)
MLLLRAPLVVMLRLELPVIVFLFRLVMPSSSSLRSTSIFRRAPSSRWRIFVVMMMMLRRRVMMMMMLLRRVMRGFLSLGVLVMHRCHRHGECRFDRHLGHGNDVQIHERKVEFVIHSGGGRRGAFDSVRIRTHLPPLTNRQSQMFSLIQFHSTIPQNDRSSSSSSSFLALFGNSTKDIDLLVASAQRNGTRFVTDFHLGDEDTRTIDAILVYY